MRDHLESVYRQTGVLPAQLDPIDCPEEILYIWGYFQLLNRRRQNYGFGPATISYVEMITWAEANSVDLTSFEVRALDALEVTFLNWSRKQK